MKIKIYMALDTETTGFKPGQICQLSYLLFTDITWVQSYNQFCTVDKVEEGASNIHGFTVERLKELSGGFGFSINAGRVIQDLIDVDKIYIHNAQFDISFLNAEFERLNVKYDFAPKTFCTMNHHTDIIKLPAHQGRSGYKWPKLAETAEYYGIDANKMLADANKMFTCENIGFHDARFDVVALYNIVMAMKKDKEKKGDEHDELTKTD